MRTLDINGVKVEFDPGPDYRNRVYDRFHVRRDPSTGPGWYVFGRNPEYGDHLIKLCARPDLKARSHPHYNCQVRRGFKTKREAQAIADHLNNMEKPT